MWSKNRDSWQAALDDVHWRNVPQL